MKPHILSDTEFAALASRLRADLANLTGAAVEARAREAALLEALRTVAKALPLIADGLCSPGDIRAVADVAQRAADAATGGTSAEALAETKRRIAASTPSGPGRRRALEGDDE